jgi:cytochrome P450
MRWSRIGAGLGHFISSRTIGVASRIVRSAPVKSRAPQVKPNERAKFEGSGPIGNLGRMRKRPLAFLLEAHQTSGAVAKFRLGPFSAFLATSPEAVHQVLVDTEKHYDRNTRQFEIIGIGLGQSLLTTSGEFWLQQRRKAQPAFHRKRIEALGENMAKVVAAELDSLPPEERVVDFTKVAFSMAFELVLQTMFSTASGGDKLKIAGAIETMTSWIDAAMTSLAFVPAWVPTRKNRKFHAAGKSIDELCARIIRERTSKGQGSTEPNDLLALLLGACDPASGEGFDHKQLTTEVKTMVLAGHDTVAHSLCWLVALLGQHPEVKQALLAEIDGVLAGRTPTQADMANLPLLTRVIKETLRLYPAGWLIGRNAREVHDLQGVRVPKKALMFVVPYVVHRSPEYWPEPERFVPDRFLPEAEAARPKHAYIPFGAGPHVCIGQAFAMLELQMMTSMLLQRFEVETLGPMPEPNPRITLGLVGGLPVRMIPRVD